MGYAVKPDYRLHATVTTTARDGSHRADHLVGTSAQISAAIKDTIDYELKYVTGSVIAVQVIHPMNVTNLER